MGKSQDWLFGTGMGIGVVLGFFLGTMLMARLGDEATDAIRSVAGRVLGRKETVHFEALLQ